MKRLDPYEDISAGTTVHLTNAFSDMERDMLNKYGIKTLTFEGYSKPHGFARCKDDHGVLWHIHPESLSY